MRDFIVKILVKIRLYKPIVELIKRIKFRRQARLMQNYGLQMLAQADRVFSSMGLQVFLTYGTLLGAYRDHGFISYDPDIDLGIRADDVPDGLHENMSNAGFRLIRQNISSTKEVLEETYLYKGLHLDIFYYRQDGEDWYSVIQRKHEYKEWKEANATDGFPCDRSYVPASEMERINFLGTLVYIPKLTDQWLRDIYSDSYMIPIKNWNAKDYKTRIVHTEERSYRVLCEA